MDFHSTHIFVMKKVENNKNFAAGGIINHRAHYNSSLQRQEQTVGDQLCDGLQGSE
jgi:hypothetical protein